MYLMHFVFVTLLFQLLAKIVQLLYQVNDLSTSICIHVNDSSATPHYTRIATFAIIKLFLLIKTRAKTNHMDSTRLASLSMNELTTDYWNSYTI